MQPPSLDKVVIALRAGTNVETNLPWADSIIAAPVRLAPFRRDMTVSVLLFLSNMQGRSSFVLSMSAELDGRELSSLTSEVPRDPGEHHWHHHPISFPAIEAGSYRLSVVLRFPDGQELRWSESLTVQRDP